MTVAQDFIKKLQDATGNELLPLKFWENSSHHIGILTFQDVLNNYAEYYSDLSPSQKEKMNKLFWEQVKAIGGTPIIENHLDSEQECNVYFLFPKKNLTESTEAPGTKKDLYLQGDFHGYGSTDDRQRLFELSDTGIMQRKYSMPTEALVVYQYIEVEPSHRGKKPEPERAPFFKKDNKFVPLSTNKARFPDIPQSPCIDNYSTHTSNFPGFSSSTMIRVSVDSKHAHIPSNPIDWPSLLTKEPPSDSNYFTYHATLYSDKEGNLHQSDAIVGKKYHDDLFHSDSSESPYANFTRDIQVFKPKSGNIADIVVVNDGRPYLMTGIIDYFEKIVAEQKLSADTAFVFIDSLPGLKNTLSPVAAEAFNNDPSKDLSGMGVRLIDYKHEVDQYTDFIASQLCPWLEKEINAPKDPSHRIMIGSSLSGTASVYIGLKCPHLFGAIIAQSPSPDNRAILSNIPSDMLTGRHIHLSCGTFEHPNYAAANANIDYAQELSDKLDIPLHIGLHGHEFIAWNEELEQSLPAALTLASLKAAREINHQYREVLDDMKASTTSSISAIEEDVTVGNHRVPSPFQVTPKPSGGEY